MHIENNYEKVQHKSMNITMCCCYINIALEFVMIDDCTMKCLTQKTGNETFREDFELIMKYNNKSEWFQRHFLEVA